MLSEIKFLYGPPRSGKTAKVRQIYLDLVKTHGPDATLYLLPTADSVRRERVSICEQLNGSAITSLITTFPQLAEHILIESDSYFTRISSPLDKLIMYEAVQRTANDLSSPSLSRALKLPGFIEAVTNIIGEFKRAGLDETEAPEIFQDAGIIDPRTKEILQIYSTYQIIL